MVHLVKRHGFSLALVSSLALHGALAIYAFQPEIVPVRLAPFRHGKMTVALRPTVVEQWRPDPLPEKVVKREIVEHAAAPVFRQLTHPRREESARLSEPMQAEPRLDAFASVVPRQAEPQTPIAQPRMSRKSIRDPLAVVAEQAQPLLSRQDDGSPDAAARAADYLPHPPFPPNRPVRPILITVSCIVGADGRFYEVAASTGDSEWDRYLEQFIERHWRAAPQRRGGVPVASAKSYELNYYQQQ